MGRMHVIYQGLFTACNKELDLQESISTSLLTTLAPFIRSSLARRPIAAEGGYHWLEVAVHLYSYKQKGEQGNVGKVFRE